MTKRTTKKYFPALGYNFLTAFYDFIMRILVGNKFRTKFVNFISVRGDEKILDFGTGTGEIVIRIKEQWPELKIFGIDIDDKILKIAHKKIEKKGINGIQLSLYDGEKLPFNDNTFDKIILSLVLCNLSNSDKIIYLNEIFRVMKLGGSLYICDFGDEVSKIKKIVFYFFRFLTPLRTLLNNPKPITDLISESGFSEIFIGEQIKIITGTLNYYRTTK